MNHCLTKTIAFPEVSGCLVEKPECGFAHKFGFSYVCSHPDHTKFRAHAIGTLTKDGVHELYDELRRRRRDEFTEQLDEASRNSFCHQNDFFGKPLISTDLKQN